MYITISLTYEKIARTYFNNLKNTPNGQSQVYNTNKNGNRQKLVVKNKQELEKELSV